MHFRDAHNICNFQWKIGIHTPPPQAVSQTTILIWIDLNVKTNLKVKYCFIMEKYNFDVKIPENIIDILEMTLKSC